jgi:hypothetical protein
MVGTRAILRRYASLIRLTVNGAIAPSSSTVENKSLNFSLANGKKSLIIGSLKSCGPSGTPVSQSYGNENWEFDDAGVMHHRYACINDLAIKESERLYHWPLGRRPDDHPGLSELGL